MFSNVILIGNLGRDPEVRITTTGKKVATLSLAIKRFGREQPVWVKVVAWEKTADNCERFGKGDLIMVRGEMDDKEWVDKEGKKRLDQFINAVLILNMGPKKEAPAPAATSDEVVPW
jgi:single-strand DNA-binding protein